MSRYLFLRILHEVEGHDNYFTQRRDTMGRLGLSSIQKVTAVFRMLAYGLPADAVDEYIKIGESTTIESMKRFCRAIVEIFSGQYLRSPTPDDVSRLLYIGEKRGFLGMLGSLDCMHWRWKNCPTAWTGQYAGRSGSPTIILEAMADYDLWIWHANILDCQGLIMILMCWSLLTFSPISLKVLLLLSIMSFKENNIIWVITWPIVYIRNAQS